jgi:hypothetical protein
MVFEATLGAPAHDLPLIALELAAGGWLALARSPGRVTLFGVRDSARYVLRGPQRA